MLGPRTILQGHNRVRIYDQTKLLHAIRYACVCCEKGFVQWPPALIKNFACFPCLTPAFIYGCFKVKWFRVCNAIEKKRHLESQWR